MKPYQRLEKALSRLLGAETPLKATLGYTVGGAYTVVVPGNSACYYARFPDGSFAEVYHRGRAAPLPDLPVEIGFDSAGRMVILGADPQRAGLFAGDHEVGIHGHARGSGMEFPIDPRLLTPLKAAPLGGLRVSVAQGAYWDGSALRWWAGGAVTLTPPGSANSWAWVIVALAAGANALVSASGTALTTAAPLDPATIPAADLGGAIPLAAVRVRNGQTELEEADFEDLRFVVGGRGSSRIILREELAQNSSAGSFSSGAWQTRALNTLAADGGGYASLASSQVTLAAGTYSLRASAPAFAVDRHQTRWQNVTDNTTTLLGTPEFAAAVQTRSEIVGRFSISASSTFELQHRCETTRGTDGFGVAGDFAAEVYATVELWKEA